MKKITTLILIITPMIIFSQPRVLLKLSQPPELSFSQSASDTSIYRGETIVLGTDLFINGGKSPYIFHWTPEASLDDPSSPNPVAKPDSTTTYLLNVVDGNGCSLSLDYLVNVKTPTPVVKLISSGESKLSVKLYPNPNHGSFTIHITGEKTPLLKISILDQSGKLLHYTTIKDFDGDCSEPLKLSLASGIYVLFVTGGVNIVYRQFIIN